MTSDGTVLVGNLEADATYEYSTDGGETWTEGSGTSFELPEGVYTDVQVRQADLAGNVGEPTSLGPITVDLSVAAPTGALVTDTGTPAADGVTSDGTVLVGNLEDGATFEYSTDGGLNWTPGTGTGFELAEGVYPDVQVRQIDLAGNVSDPTLLGAIEVAFPAATDDTATLDMGAQSSVTNPPVTDTDVEVLGLTESTVGADNSVTITVPEDTVGSVRIEVSQTALVAVADAFLLEVLDADGNVVYSAVTENSLVGDVAGLELLGLTSDNTLVAIVEGLPPGEYTVVVRNDESALAQLLDTDGGGVSLEELGDAGVVLGAENQEIILDAVEDALGVLGGPARALLEPLLGLTDSLSGVVDLLTDVLTTLGATELLDTVIDAVADNLLSNTLTLLQSTSITTTVTEYDFANETLSGNVITGDAGGGADDLAGGASVTSVTNADGTVVDVPATGTVDITGEYGVLTLAADGSYTYAGYGDPGAVGQSEVFTYTLSDGVVSDTATLTIEIEGSAVAATDDTAGASVEFANVVDNGYFNEGATLAAVLAGSEYISDTFTIGANVALAGTVSVDSTVSAVADGTLYIEEETSPGIWTVVEEIPFDVVLAIGNVATLDLATLGLDEGTYRVRTELTGLAAVVSITTDVDITYLDQFTVDGTTGADGNLLTNDEPGSLLTELQIFDPATSAYIEVEAGTPVTIEGTYGTLTLEVDGSYTYTPDPVQAYFDETQVDTFEYLLVHPGGQIAQGTLEVSVEPSGAGVPVPLAASTFDIEPDTIPVDDLTPADGEPQAEVQATGFFEFDMLEGQGTLEDVLENYLSEAETALGSGHDGTGLAVISGPDTIDPAVTYEDPLGHLALNPDVSLEEQWNNNSVI